MKKIMMPAALVAAVGLWGCSDTLTMPMPDTLLSSAASSGWQVENPQLPDDVTDSSSTCPDGVDGWLKVDSAEGDWGEFSYDEKTLEYLVEHGYIVQFCIKSGQDEGTSFYEIEGFEEDSITISKDISHTAYRVVFIPDENGNNGEWCSPGFWRNNPIAAGEALEAAVEDGLEIEDGQGLADLLYYQFFLYHPPLSPQGVRLNADPEPSLWKVLTYPQYYGGDAFNKVGDLLSIWHPDVNFFERVSDSCPLPADASRK